MASAAHENDEENDNERKRDEHVEQRRERHTTSAPTGPAFAEPEQPVGDLAPELARVLPREANELVRCRRVSGNHYRCNWWGPQDTMGYDNPGMGGLLVTSPLFSKKWTSLAIAESAKYGSAAPGRRAAENTCG